MNDIEEVADRIFRLDIQRTGTDDRTSVYLIRDGEGALIEPGPASLVPAIEEGMKQLGLRNLSYIIPSHIHMDHGGGMGKLAEMFPQALVVVHPRGARHAIDPSRLIRATRAFHGDDFEVRFGSILPVPESQVKVPEDGEALSIDGRELQVIYAPGHAHHHIITFDKKTGGLFCGQALGVSGAPVASFPLPSAAPPDFDAESYLSTIERIKRLNPRLLFYSRGGVISEPEPLITRLTENTLMLRDVILDAVKEGKTPEAIAGRVREHASAHLGLDLSNVGVEATILGYITHFKKKGIV